MKEHLNQKPWFLNGPVAVQLNTFVKLKDRTKSQNLIAALKNSSVVVTL